MSKKDSVHNKLWEGLGLREKQILFIMYRLDPEEKCKTDYEAYIKAGYEPSSVQSGRVGASTLKNNEKVLEGMRRYEKYLLGGDRLSLTMDLVSVLKKQANWKPETFFDENFSPRPIEEIHPDDQVCIEQIEKKAYANGEVMITNYKMVDRGKAQDRLTKLLLEDGKGVKGTEVNVKTDGKLKGIEIRVMNDGKK
jgi:hypothetical protein